MEKEFEKEQQLLRRISEADDTEAYREIFRTYYAPLCLYTTRFVHASSEAEDIVQEIFYRLWRDRKELRIQVSIKAYLVSSVKHYALNVLKHRVVEQSYVSEFLRNNGENPVTEEELYTAAELQQRIDLIISRFPEKLRNVFLMHRRQGMTYVQISDAMSISIKTVEAYMSKCLALLRSELKEFMSILIFLFFLTME